MAAVFGWDGDVEAGDGAGVGAVSKDDAGFDFLILGFSTVAPSMTIGGSSLVSAPVTATCAEADIETLEIAHELRSIVLHVERR